MDGLYAKWENPDIGAGGVWFHLCGMSKIGKSIDKNGIRSCQWLGEGEAWEGTSNMDRLSALGVSGSVVMFLQLSKPNPKALACTLWNRNSVPKLTS